MKTCPRCKQTKQADMFYHCSTRPGKLSRLCRECTMDYNREYQQRHPKGTERDTTEQDRLADLLLARPLLIGKCLDTLSPEDRRMIAAKIGDVIHARVGPAGYGSRSCS